MVWSSLGGAKEVNVTCTGSIYPNNTGYIVPTSLPPDIFVDGRLASWSAYYTPLYFNTDIAGIWQTLGGRRQLLGSDLRGGSTISLNVGWRSSASRLNFL
jgi:hypothetical protein